MFTCFRGLHPSLTFLDQILALLTGGEGNHNFVRFVVLQDIT